MVALCTSKMMAIGGSIAEARRQFDEYSIKTCYGIEGIAVWIVARRCWRARWAAMRSSAVMWTEVIFVVEVAIGFALDAFFAQELDKETAHLAEHGACLLLVSCRRGWRRAACRGTSRCPRCRSRAGAGGGRSPWCGVRWCRADTDRCPKRGRAPASAMSALPGTSDRRTCSWSCRFPAEVVAHTLHGAGGSQAQVFGETGVPDGRFAGLGLPGGAVG